MGKDYKAVPFKAVKHHEAVAGEEPWDSEPAWDTRETRYCIISAETGEVLDDAQGYGYKSAQKAYAAYGYKNRDRSKDKERKAKEVKIRKWMKEHKDFVGLMDAYAFDIAKGRMGPDDKFDARFVKQMLAENGLKPDFTAGELLGAWKKL